MSSNARRLCGPTPAPRERRGRAAIAAAGLALMTACGDLPRFIALDHQVDPACDVTLSAAGTSTTAKAGEAVTIEIDDDRARPTLTSTCTLNGRAEARSCELDFGPDGTEVIRVDEGSGAGDLAVSCPADRWTDAGPR